MNMWKKIIFIVITFCCYLIASDSNSGISMSIDTFGKYNFQNDDDYDVDSKEINLKLQITIGFGYKF